MKNSYFQNLIAGVSVEYLQSRFYWFFDLQRPLDSHKLEQYRFQTDRLDIFFSHVWGSSPFWRHVGALWYLNHRKASLVTALTVAFVSCSLVLVDGRSWVVLERTSGLTASSLMAILATLFLFLLIWNFDYFIPTCMLFPNKRRLCFIDRLCINQDCPEEKSRGISEIPYILENSQRFVVLLSENYFDRLWCCYELAVFRSCALGASQKVAIIPLKFVSLTLLMTMFDMLSAVLFRSNLRSILSNSDGKTFLIVSVIFGITSACLTYFVAVTWDNDSHKMRNRISNFALDSVSCTDETDRLLLLADIEKRFNGGQNFETLVRSEITAQVGDKPKINHSIFIALPTLLSLMAYLSVVGQRMSLACINEMDTSTFIRRDDSSCVILDRPPWSVWPENKLFHNLLVVHSVPDIYICRVRDLFHCRIQIYCVNTLR